MPKELSLKQNLLKEMFEESLTRSEFEEIAVKLAEHVKKIDARNKQDVEKMNNAIVSLFSGSKTETRAELEQLKTDLKNIVDSTLKTIENRIESKVVEIDNRLMSIKDGKDADEELILQKLLDSIKIPTIEEIKDDLPVMGEEVRDSLELLKDDERLDVSAIKGIKKLITSMLPKQSLGAVGIRQFDIGIETPVGTQNGSNTDFTVTFKPEYVTYNGQILYEGNGYSFANKTLTFDNAPEASDVIRSHYKNI